MRADARKKKKDKINDLQHNYALGTLRKFVRLSEN